MNHPRELADDSDLYRTEVCVPTTESRLFPVADASLVYIYPKAAELGRRYPVRVQPVTIGRAAECDVVVGDSSVSRIHARIEVGPNGRHVVTDLGSTNGTFVNSVRTGSGPLQDGDYLRVGNCIYRYLAGGNVEAEYHEEIYRLTVMDPLTGVHNRRYLMEVLNREVARSVRHCRPMALALIDVDFFKAVNDRLGHVAGDMTLRQLASCIGKLVRSDEVFARYGGEEFAVVLTETGRDAAAQFGERVRASVEAHPFAFEGHRYTVTVSVGVGTTDGSEPLTPEQLTQRADEVLYRAKHEGRNRVAV
jgi:diguanylate cyclase (GGDEF)-like protein